jgi:hypothetical protein
LALKAAPALALAQQPDARRVGDRQDVLHAALSEVVEDGALLTPAQVIAGQRGQPDMTRFLGVLLAADAEQADVEQPRGARANALTGGLLGLLERRPHPRPQPRQRPREVLHLPELLALTLFTPDRAVQVLRAPGRVDSGRLQVPVRIRADPHLAPRRRDRQRLDSPDSVLVADALPVDVEVDEAAPAAQSTEPRDRAIGSAQSNPSCH